MFGSKVPQEVNTLTGRFVLTIKDERNKNEVWKARFVVQGHKNKYKDQMIYFFARQHTTKLLVGFDAIFGFRIFSTDVTQVYTQSRESLQREIFITSPKELNFGPDQIIKLIKPLYDLTESGDYRGKNFETA